MVYLQVREGVGHKTGDLVPCQVEDPQVLQTFEDAAVEEMDTISIERQFHQVLLGPEGAGLQGGDAVVLDIEVLETQER